MIERPEQVFLKLLMKGRRPRVLYHYTPGSGLLGILNERSIWATDIRYLNDSSEYNYALQMVGTVISERKAKADSKFSLGLFDALESRLAVEARTEVFVASFTEQPDQLSQWRAYCSPHGGYAIGFESGKLTSASTNDGCWLVRCQYEELAQLTLAEKLLGLVVGSAEEVRNRTQLDRVYREAYKLLGRLLHLFAPAVKNPSFEEEQEWRLVRLSDSIQVAPRFRMSRSMLIPYHLHSLAPEGDAPPISCIIVGPTPHPNLTIEATKALLSSHSLSSARVDASEVPFRAW